MENIIIIKNNGHYLYECKYLKKKKKKKKKKKYYCRNNSNNTKDSTNTKKTLSKINQPLNLFIKKH